MDSCKKGMLKLIKELEKRNLKSIQEQEKKNKDNVNDNCAVERGDEVSPLNYILGNRSAVIMNSNSSQSHNIENGSHSGQQGTRGKLLSDGLIPTGIEFVNSDQQTCNLIRSSSEGGSIIDDTESDVDYESSSEDAAERCSDTDNGALESTNHHRNIDASSPSGEQLSTPIYSVGNQNENNHVKKRKVINKSEIIQQGKKRVVHYGEWKSTKRKFNRAGGMAYTSKTGKDVAARKMKPPCSCRFKCYQKISENDRLAIFNSYWDPEKDNNVKRQYIISCVDTTRPASTRRNATKPKNNTLTYRFMIQNNAIKICKLMFLNTLCISNTTVITALKKRRSGGVVEEDRRGRHVSSKKISQVAIDSATDHTSSPSVYKSHYRRERNSTNFLSPDINVKTMYDLYLKFCFEQQLIATKMDVQRQLQQKL